MAAVCVGIGTICSNKPTAYKFYLFSAQFTLSLINYYRIKHINVLKSNKSSIKLNALLFVKLSDGFAVKEICHRCSDGK